MLQALDRNVTRFPPALKTIVWFIRRLVFSNPFAFKWSRLSMPTRDFLRKKAHTALRECYIAAGAICSFSTNYERLLTATRASFVRIEPEPASIDFSVRIWIDDSRRSQRPWPKPCVRGLDHLIFAAFDAGSSLLADLRSRSVIGRFSAAMADDTPYWETVILPMLLTMMSASVGVAELHCACVAKGEAGILLAGPSGAGKSTLALALSRIGFRFLSDDRTFCSADRAGVQAWGLSTRLKLRPEAAQWFEELHNKKPNDTHSDDPSLWLDPEHLAGVERTRKCQPRSLIFLERSKEAKFQLSAIASGDALRRLSNELISELPEAHAKRSKTLEQIVRLPCWLLRYGTGPHATARSISDALSHPTSELR
jgi:hypothetical protein